MKMFIVKNARTGKCREVKMKDILTMKLEPEIGDHINWDEIIIKIFEKEVKKLKYFETKVVKVKKECEHLQIYYKPGMIGYRCHNCGNIVDVNRHEIKKQPKGNWVNGENLDKIKFPCFCTFSERNELGMLTSGCPSDPDIDEYILHRIEEGQQNCSAMDRNNSLRDLIKNCNIHILKGKLIIYKEE